MAAVARMRTLPEWAPLASTSVILTCLGLSVRASRARESRVARRSGVGNVVARMGASSAGSVSGVHAVGVPFVATFTPSLRREAGVGISFGSTITDSIVISNTSSILYVCVSSASLHHHSSLSTTQPLNYTQHTRRGDE